MGKLSKLFKKYSWLWGEEVRQWYTLPKLEIEVLGRRLRERGVGELAEYLDRYEEEYEEKGLNYAMTVRVNSLEASVTITCPRAFPDLCFEVNIPSERNVRRWTGILVGEPSSETVRVPDRGEVFKLDVDLELLKELEKPEKKEKVEEALICFLYDIFDKRILADWAFETEEGRELWNAIKSECGESIYWREVVRIARGLSIFRPAIEYALEEERKKSRK
ncbi:MAG: hypothetical protein DRN54_03445 [Thaumarchaeota archaeon]|nr:MAG: hypothetical protein DRN54_03445 [Nitrososphaerota archaeon]